MKKEEVINLLLFLKACLEQKVKKFDDILRIYTEETNEKVERAGLKIMLDSATIDYLDPKIFSSYCNKYQVVVEWPNKSTRETKEFTFTMEIKDSIKTFSNVLSITEKDLVDVFKIDLENDTPELACQKIDKKIGDYNFLLKYLGKDPGMYEIRKEERGTWTTTMKLNQGGNFEIPQQVYNKKFSLTIVKRKEPFIYIDKEEVTNFLSNYFINQKISPFQIIDSKNKSLPLNEDKLIVYPGMELHLGKLGTIADFEDYGTKQAMWRIKYAAQETIKIQKHERAASILMGLGNYYLNSDNPDSMTTGGTNQTDDSRFKEIYLWGQIGYVRLLETFKEYFNKIHVKHCPGNHDEKSMFDLYTHLYHIYKLTEDKKIEIGMTFKDIRYATSHVFGDYLIVMLHGKTPKGMSQSNKKLSEYPDKFFPEEARSAKKIYVLSGHLHEDIFSTYGKITVIRTAALTGYDPYHVDSGYIGSRVGHSVLTFDKRMGLININNINVGDQEKKNKIANIRREENLDVLEEMTKAFDLNPSFIEQGIDKSIESSFSSITSKVNKEYMKQLKNILDVLKYDRTIDDEQKSKILKSLGYNKEIKKINKEFEEYKKYVLHI